MAQPQSTSTTQTITTYQPVIGAPTSSTVSVGNYVTDVSIQPYIPSRIISFYAYNLRPNQKISVFFDSVNVTKYCAPGTIGTVISNDYNSVTKTGAWGDTIYSDASGHVAGQFLVPAGQFKSGDRVLQVADIDDIQQGRYAYSTFASAIFTSSYLNVTKQGITLTSVNPSLSFIPLSTTIISNPTYPPVPVPPTPVPPTPTPVIPTPTPVTPTPTPVTPVTNIKVNIGTYTNWSEGDQTPDLAGVTSTTVDSLNNKAQYQTLTTNDIGINYATGQSYAIDPNNANAVQFAFNRNLQQALGDYVNSTGLNNVPITTLNANDVGSEGYVNGNNPGSATASATIVLNGTTTDPGTGIVTFNFTTVDVSSAYIPPSCGEDPIAQVFTINLVNNLAGLYATSIDVFFKQKSSIASNGVSLMLFDTTNAYPNGQSILPFSTVHMLQSNIPVSDDATALTRFTFEAPVFLNNGKTYAFVIKPDNNDPDYLVYTATLGESDITSGTQMYAAPSIGGTLFEGANLNEWAPVQDEYIKFNINRASFNSYTGTAILQNIDEDFVHINNITFANSTVDVAIGDIVYGATVSTAGVVNTSIYGTVNAYDDLTGIVYVANTTGNFATIPYIQIHRFSNSTLSPSSTTYIATANFLGVLNPVVDAVVPSLAIISPSGTSLSLSYNGTSNSYVIDSNSTNISMGIDHEFYDYERIVASRTNEKSHMSSNKSFAYNVAMTTTSTYVSPLIDLVKNNQLILENLVDPVGIDYNNYYNNSSSKSKYISKIVTLAEGQDAEDIQIILSAFRPQSSDIQVWVKFQNSEDSDPFITKTWTPLTNLSSSLYSGNDPSDFKEFVFGVANSYNGIIKTGTVTISNSSTTITGNSTSFTTNLQVGNYIVPPSNSTFTETPRKIIQISNNTSVVVDSTFTGNYSNSLYYVVPPPTTAFLSKNSQQQLTGTVTANTTSNIITGSGTNFTGQLTVGSEISIAGDIQAVIAIANSTQLTVGAPWTSNQTSANAYLSTPTGITYLNSTGSVYTTYKKFQLKIVFQSDDSSRPPIIDNLRVLALQL